MTKGPMLPSCRESSKLYLSGAWRHSSMIHFLPKILIASPHNPFSGLKLKKKKKNPVN